MKLSTRILLLLTFNIILIAQSVKFTMEDSDNDTFYDKLEIAAGTNPNENECKSKKCPEANPEGISDSDYFIILLDQSGSMESKLGKSSESRMTVAKRVMKEFINNATNSLKIGIYTFGGKQAQCDEDPLLEIQSPFKKSNSKKLHSEIDKLEPIGDTPIGGSLNSLTKILSNKKGIFQVLLITDGAASCTEVDPIFAAKNLVALNSEKLRIKFYIAGLDMDKSTADQMKEIADNSQGEYFDISNEDEFKNIFLTPLKAIIVNLKGMVCLQAMTDELLLCEQNRFNKIKNVFPKKINTPIPNEFTEEEKAFLISKLPKLEEKFSLRNEKYMEIKLKKHGDYQKRIDEITKMLKPTIKN
ncbi:MAG: VWA domain-containing protein [Leptospiraceae bacterium]|nr:VWA domain-containing protein [Leptospiraceae bacterium]